MSRGYYTRSVIAAWNFRNGKLVNQWVFDSDDPLIRAIELTADKAIII